MFQMFQLSFRNPLLTCRICPFLCDIPARKPLVHPFSIWSKYNSPLITQSQSSPNGLPSRNCSYTTLHTIRNSKPLRPLKIYHYALGCIPCQKQWQVKVHTDPLLRMCKNQSWGWQFAGRGAKTQITPIDICQSRGVHPWMDMVTSSKSQCKLHHHSVAAAPLSNNGNSSSSTTTTTNSNNNNNNKSPGEQNSHIQNPMKNKLIFSTTLSGAMLASGRVEIRKSTQLARAYTAEN